MNKIKRWIIEKLGGTVIEPKYYNYLITAVNQRGETVPWTTINPDKRNTKYNRVEYHNLYQNDELKFSFPTKQTKK